MNNVITKLTIKLSDILNVMLDMNNAYSKLKGTPNDGVSEFDLEIMAWNILNSNTLRDKGIAASVDLSAFTHEAVMEALAGEYDETGKNRFILDNRLFDEETGSVFFSGEKMEPIVRFYNNEPERGVHLVSVGVYGMKDVCGEIYAFSKYGRLGNVVSIPFANWFTDYAYAIDKYEKENCAGISTIYSAFSFAKTAEIMLSGQTGYDIRFQIPPYGEKGWRRYTDYRFEPEILNPAKSAYPRQYSGIGASISNNRDRFFVYSISHFDRDMREFKELDSERIANMDDALKPLYELCMSKSNLPHDNRNLYAIMPLVLQLQEKKERDYGRSWNCGGDPTLGHMTACSEILKKSERIKNLIIANAGKGFKNVAGDWHSNNEPFADTLLDLAVYCLLYRGWLAEQNPRGYAEYCENVGVTEHIAHFPIN